LKWVEQSAQVAFVRVVLPPLGPSIGVTQLRESIQLLIVSAL
jgi:hypothetical protein